jgi:hypothetical protein
MPSIVPMYGLMIRITYSGVSKVCSKCLKYLKKAVDCVKHKLSDYLTQIKEDNPYISSEMIDKILEDDAWEKSNNDSSTSCSSHGIYTLLEKLT